MKKAFDFVLIMLLFAATMYWSFEFVYNMVGAFYEEAGVSIFMSSLGFTCLVYKISRIKN